MSPEQIRCSDINPDPRSSGHPSHEVAALAADIREHGVLRPVLLRATPKGYVIVHGERRWLAARQAGLAAVPAYVVHDLSCDDGITA